MKHTNSTSLNRRGVPVALLLGAALVLIAAGLAHSAPAPANATNSILAHLRTVKGSWMKPCAGKAELNGTEPRTRRTASTRKRQAGETLLTQINQSLNELDNWREVSKDIDRHTNWNNEERKKQFAFLTPFKHEPKKMFNKLSIYWASLEMVSFLTKEQGESTVVSRQELEAVDGVQTGIGQLLCQLQVYIKTRSKMESRPIAPERMSQHLQPFRVQDPNEIRIHIWYVMCRLDCFLTNMQQYIVKENARMLKSPQETEGKGDGKGEGKGEGKGKGKGRRKPAERKIPCDKCPHKPEIKRKPQQNKQRQQQQKQDGQLPEQQHQQQQQQKKKQQKLPRQQGRQRMQKNHNRAQRNNTRKATAGRRHAEQG